MQLTPIDMYYRWFYVLHYQWCLIIVVHGANYNVELIVVNDFKINQCINYEEIIVCTGSRENLLLDISFYELCLIWILIINKYKWWSHK